MIFRIIVFCRGTIILKGVIFVSKRNKKSNRSATSAQQRLIKAYNAMSTDNDNINDQHNTQKQALGPNTRV